MAGSVSGLLFASGGDMPQVSALDDYAPSTITRVYAADGQVVGEFATQRRVVISSDQISPLLRQAIIAAEDQSFDSHLGLSLPRIVVTAIKDVMRGQRAGASTLTQQLAQQSVPHQREDARPQDQGSVPDDSDREALHEARDLHALLQSHSLGPRDVRRRSRVPSVFRQVGEGPHARGSGAARRHHPAAVAAEPIREPRSGPPAPQLRPATDGRREVHHAGARRSGEAGADRHQRPAADEYASRRSSSRTSGSTSRSAMARSGCTRAAWPSTRRSTSICSARRRRRSTPACARWTSAAASASRAATSSPTGRRSTRFQHDRWKSPIRVGDIVPAVVVGSGGTGPRAVPAASVLLRAGRYYVEVAKIGLRVDAQEGSRLPQAGRSRAGEDSDDRRGRPLRDRQPRSGSDRRRRARRHRQPHRPDPRDDRRLRFREEQVQSGDAGLAADGLDVQADRLHGGHRPRLHAGVGHRGRAGRLPCRPEPAALLAAELRPQVRRAR